ncbi:MAG: hypothetical protein BWK78_00960 [Thiotrichaceae bacterium IS1]|nr:MAG: hypothetical protein BWK78_00960 [Thiotrichaceae bacterium IS1]
MTEIELKQQIQRAVEKATVKIFVDESEKPQGTGFFITGDGYLLTAYHCIRAEGEKYPPEIEIQTGTGDKFKAQLDEAKSLPQKDYDIAVLKVFYHPEYYLPLGVVSDNDRDDEVVSLGYPAVHLYESERIGTYSGKISRLPTDNKIEITNAVQGSGHSGSALYHYASKRVIGILSEVYEPDVMTNAGLAVGFGPLFEKWLELKNVTKQVAKEWDERLKQLGVKSPTPTDFTPQWFGYDKHWVGREKLTAELIVKMRNDCRLLLILGLTGIGKTALAEKIAIELADWLEEDWQNSFRRANFDYSEKSTDFVTVATRWLEEWGEKLTPEDTKPERLLNRLVKRLCDKRVLVLIDSMERLLTGNEEEGWGDFADNWWEKFFLHLLSAESCQSRLIVTSQDLPVQLVNSRFKNFWHHHILYGLDEFEQEALFKITGLDISPTSSNRPLLMRLGKAYKGHPLVLRVIIGEICESFSRNVQAYWNEVGSKIEEVEKALAEAEADAGKKIGRHDEWELHKLTREVCLKVNKQRLQSVFERLAKQVKDAYLLVCAASVYRVPVQEIGWLMQLANFVRRLERQECSQQRKDRALDELCKRFLVEESVNHNNKRVVGQHNLVRSVALEHNKQLLQRLKEEMKSV